MKSICGLILAIVCLAPYISQSAREPGDLTLGINPVNGRLIATDVWTSEYQAMQKESDGIMNSIQNGSSRFGRTHIRRKFILGSVFELETNQTSINGTLVLGYYAPSSSANHKFFINQFTVTSFENNTLLGGAIYGDPLSSFRNIQAHYPIDDLHLEVLHREKANSEETLWILKIEYHVELNKPLDFIPRMEIVCDMGTDHWGLITKQSKKLPAVLTHLETPSKTNLQTGAKESAPPPSPQGSSKITNAGKLTTLPGITLSIEKRADMVVITYYPVVPNAKLEQANPNPAIWSWQTVSNLNTTLTNGWIINQTVDSRIFRLKLE